MGLRISQVDAFTGVPFRGNPAAVCVLPEARDEGWMRDVAREMNLSETAFLVRRADGSFDLRWFTPTVEVALCGHATLASAHVLWERGILRPEEQGQFWTKSGLLTADRLEDGWIELDFPVRAEAECPTPEGLEEALGVKPLYVGKNIFDYIVLVESEEVVRRAEPDFGYLARLPVRGVMITSRGETGEFDFVSRFFGPRAGSTRIP